MGYEFGGVVYGRLRDMQAARRARYAELLKAGMNFTQAAHAVKRCTHLYCWRTLLPIIVDSMGGIDCSSDLTPPTSFE